MSDDAVLSGSVHALEYEQQRVAVLGVEQLLALLQALETLAHVALRCALAVERPRVVWAAAPEGRLVALPHPEAFDVHDESLTARRDGEIGPSVRSVTGRR
jgi:hypothetical protein